MKKAAIIILFINLSCTLYAQPQCERPLLISTSSDYTLPRLEIETPCVNDTVGIVVRIGLRFDKAFDDSVRLTTPKEISVLDFYFVNKTKDIESEKNSDFEKFDFEEFDLEKFKIKNVALNDNYTFHDFPYYEVCVREACDAQFKIWLKEQPYSDMLEIHWFYGYDAFALSYPVFLIPKR